MITPAPYSLALDYHENTKNPSCLQSLDARTQYKVYPGAKVVSLQKNYPEDARQDKDIFIKTLLSRKSIRTFTDDGIGISTLSQLLTLSCGLRSESMDSTKRTYASAGARYPIEVYIALFNSTEVEPGLYHYNIPHNSLELMRIGNHYTKLRNLYSNQQEIIPTDFPCLILFSMVFKRTMEKYGLM